MPPVIRALCVLLLAPLLGAPAERLPTPDPLRAAGWQKGGWPGIRPANFEALPDGGLRITGVGQGSFVWRTVTKADACLYWRWRVDHGPPPTPLDRKGGDDRAIAITVGFDGWPPDAGFFQKAQFTMAQAMAGDHRLPRSAISYSWGHRAGTTPLCQPLHAGLCPCFCPAPCRYPTPAMVRRKN